MGGAERRRAVAAASGGSVAVDGFSAAQHQKAASGSWRSSDTGGMWQLEDAALISPEAVVQAAPHVGLWVRLWVRRHALMRMAHELACCFCRRTRVASRLTVLVAAAPVPAPCFADNWSVKAIGRKTTGTGRMRHLKLVQRRFKNGFREGELRPLF